MRAITALGSVIVFVVSGAAPATVIPVHQNQSIQAAIDVASDGDLILVYPGTYHENLDLLGKAITLRGFGQGVVVDGSGAADAAIVCTSNESPATRIEDMTFTGGTGHPFLGQRYGGGMMIYSAEPTVLRCNFIGNSADAGGGVFVLSGAPRFEACNFFENSVTFGEGGGGAGLNGSAAYFERCRFERNTSGLHGGGIEAVVSWPTFVNCTIAENSAPSGGGLRNGYSDITMTNCTITANSASQGAGIRASTNAVTTLYNCIVWGNDGQPILELDNAETIARSCNIEGADVLFPGGDNIDVYPSFDPSSVGALLPGSLCADAGDNRWLPAGVTGDIDGNDRVVNGIVDIGAFEVQEQACTGDIDGDGAVDIGDVALIISAWGPCGGKCPADLDGNGMVEFDDFLVLIDAWGPCF